MIQINKYLCYKCINCGRWTGRQLNKFNLDLTEYQKANIIKSMTCKCNQCGKIFKFKKQGERIRAYHIWFNDPNEMKIEIKQKNKELLEGKNAKFEFGKYN